MLAQSYDSVADGCPSLSEHWVMQNFAAGKNTAVQSSQKAVSAYFTSKHILYFGFAEQNSVAYEQV